MPTNGSSYGELTTYPHKVYFQCDDGFTLKGSSFRTCTANGSWDGKDTFCEGKSLKCEWLLRNFYEMGFDKDTTRTKMSSISTHAHKKNNNNNRNPENTG